MYSLCEYRDFRALVDCVHTFHKGKCCPTLSLSSQQRLIIRLVCFYSVEVGKNGTKEMQRPVLLCLSLLGVNIMNE